MGSTGPVALDHPAYLEFPLVVPPREPANLPLIFAPGDDWPLTGTAVLHTNDPTSPELWVPLTGQGLVYGEFVDTWTQSLVRLRQQQLPAHA